MTIGATEQRAENRGMRIFLVVAPLRDLFLNRQAKRLVGKGREKREMP